jgi:hypothetical protein
LPRDAPLRSCTSTHARRRAPTIQRLHAFIAEQGYERAGKHHEIYLSDPRRSAPDRMKTVVRQPIAAS